MKKICCVIGLLALLLSNSGAWLTASASYQANRWENLPAAALDTGWVDFTFTAWVYWHGGNPWQRIFDFGAGTETYMFLTPSMRFAIKPPGGEETGLTHSAPLPANRWVHVAVTLSGDTATLYLDGSPLVSGSMLPNPESALWENYYLGRSQYAADPVFDGLLDEVAIFDRALSAAEIASVHTGGWAGQYSKVLALHLDDTPAFDSSPVWDASGQRHQGTLMTADAANKAVTGQVGQALNLDGTDDYVALDPNLTVSNRIVIDTDAMSIERDGDNNPLAFKGTPFVANTPVDGIAKFSLVGDLTLADGEILTGVGSKAIALYIAGDVTIAPGAVVDVSAAGSVPGPGGGNAGQGHPGGKAGQGSYTSDDFTFAAWVFWNGGSLPWQRIFDFGWDTNRYMMLTPRTSDNRLRFTIANNGAGSEQQLNDASSLPTNQWVHVAVTLGGDTGTLFVNGEPVDSGSITINPNQVFGPNMWLGRSQFTADPYFYGVMDEVFVIDRALSAGEIEEMYWAGWNGIDGKVIGLHLDENPATNNLQLADSSGRTGQRNYGTLSTADSDNHSRTGRLGRALYFDGANDHVDLVYIYSLNGEWLPGGAGGNGGIDGPDENPIECPLMPGDDGSPGAVGSVDSNGGMPGTDGSSGGSEPGGDGVNSPASGSAAGLGGSGGGKGDGGSAQTVGATGGPPGDGGIGFLDTGDGGGGGAGQAGGTGSAGLPGQDGGNGSGGVNTGSGIAISGGGGGGSGRAGGGGGAGGQGTSGAGGGGGGGGGGSCLERGGNGGAGGTGGKGGLGADGGKGGASGAGGAGGGALEIVVLGQITISGQISATGGSGSSLWTAGQAGYSGANGSGGAAGSPGAHDCFICDSGAGGPGGTGGTGGSGGAGASGGNGGVGGGGAGGTIKLAAFNVEGAGAIIDTSGGAGGSPGSNDGGQGRFILGQPFEKVFGGTVNGAVSQSFSFIPKEPNPFINSSPQTPYLPFLADGPDIYGRVGGIDPSVVDAALGQFPNQAGLAMLLTEKGLPGSEWDIPGYDILLVINPSCRAQRIPSLGMGLINQVYNLLERGPANHPDFGGSGPHGLAQIEPGEVYATMVPEGQQRFNLGFLDYNYSLASMYTLTLSYGQPRILNAIAACPQAHFSATPDSGKAPLTVSFTDQSTGGPTSWAWEFGDGGSSTDRNPTYVYTKSGTYTVTLTVSNTIGPDSLIYPGRITVTDFRVYLPALLRSP